MIVEYNKYLKNNYGGDKMRKLFIIFVGFVVLATNLFSQVSSAEETKSMVKSYPLLSVNYEIFYFMKPKKSSEGYIVNAKMPINKNIGVEIGYGSFTKPVLNYSIGTNSYSGIGEEKFTDINFSILYYFWFMRELQAKFGFDYYKFNSGWILVSPSEANAGYLVEMYKSWRDNLFGINIGFILDVSVYKEFCITTKLGYRYLLVRDSVTKNGIINFSIGLSYKL